MRDLRAFASLRWSATLPAQTIQTMKVDDDHLQTQRPDGRPSPRYAIHAAPSVELDATGYAFEIPTDAAYSQLANS